MVSCRKPTPGASEPKAKEMRIIATAIVIALTATSAGCGGSSSSSSGAPARTVTQATAAPTAPTARRTQPTAAPTQPTAAPTQPTAAPNGRSARPTRTTPGAARGARTVPTQLVGRPLDVAMSRLRNAGISYKVIPLHGHSVDGATHWGVCETKAVEVPGLASGTSVDLIVAHLRCGAD
jgi:hypothetical protein